MLACLTLDSGKDLYLESDNGEQMISMGTSKTSKTQYLGSPLKTPKII